MRTIIAGGRNITDIKALYSALDSCGWFPAVVISGGAKGADYLGERFAKDADIPLEIYPANWNKFGKSAGFIRNAEMADRAEALIALWDGISKGTGNMIDLARRKKLQVYVELVAI